MIYAYFLESNSSNEYEDNTSIFKKILELNIPDENIYSENIGEKAQLKIIVNKIKQGDTLVVRSLDDCANNITQLFRVIKFFYDRQIHILSVLEPYYRPSQILLDLHKFDNTYKERIQKEGFEKAKEEGRVGRPKNPRLAQAVKLYNSGKFTIDQISKISEVSTSALYRELKRIDDD